jgi:signal transduction histidine kinase
VTTRRERARPWGEALLVGVVGALSAQEAYVGAGAAVLSPQVALALFASASLLLRCTAPVVPAALASCAAALLGTVLPLVVVLFSFAARGWLVAATVCASAAMAGNLLQTQQTLWGTRLYGPLLLLIAVMALGSWVGSRRRLVVSLAAQVDHLRVERELRAEQARLNERARIAAEMHDVLAHSLSVLALHTGALQRRASSLPRPVADRIDLLRATSTDALRDLRDVLGALHDPGADGSPGPRQMRELPALLEEARAAGQVIDADVQGDAGAIPLSHRLAIYRVVQEALTNARKHAAGAPVHLRIRYGAQESTVDVSNEAGAAGEPGVSSGYGLVGLAERVSALKGDLEHGPSGAGGWRLTARIPSTDHSPGTP